MGLEWVLLGFLFACVCVELDWIGLEQFEIDMRAATRAMHRLLVRR